MYDRRIGLESAVLPTFGQYLRQSFGWYYTIRRSSDFVAPVEVKEEPGEGRGEGGLVFPVLTVVSGCVIHRKEDPLLAW